MKKVILILSCLFMSIGLVTAQTRAISGHVYDEAGEPLISVSVVVKGTTIGVPTDLDGNFTLNVPDNKNTLVFHLIGLKQVELEAKNGMRVMMEEDATLLGEVMVVAYGTVKKDSFTGSAGVVNSRQMKNLQVSSVSKALEGAVPGLKASSVSGQPGSNATIRVRGFGSISAGNDPLIVVDGTAYDGNMNAFNQEDIESITVLKDAASSALYGSRGANGVVMITTKKGQAGKTKVSLDIRQGFNKQGLSRYNTMTSAEDYLKTYWTGLYNSQYYKAGNVEGAPSYVNPGVNASAKLFDDLGGYNPYLGIANDKVIDSEGNFAPNLRRKYNDNWEDEVYKTGYRQEYNVGISGGSDKSTSYLSLGYIDDGGIVEGTGFTRYSARLNQSYNLTKNLEVGGNVAYSHTKMKETRSATSRGNASSLFAFINGVAPIYPVFMYDKEGNVMHNNQGGRLFDYGDSEMPGTGARLYAPMQNPVAAGFNDKRITTEDNVNTRGFASYSFLKYFKASANVGYDVRTRSLNQLYNPSFGDAKTVSGRVQKDRRRYETLTFNQLLNFDKTFADVHNVSALLGHETYQYKMDYLYAEKTGMFLDDLDEFNNAVTMTSLNSYQNRKSVEGYLSQLLYDYDNRYYFSASYRRDGSSIFHKDVRWGNFWSVGGSWRVTEEDFMKGIDWVNNFRLRTSYGVQGNDNILDRIGNFVYRPYADSYSVEQADGGGYGLVQVYEGNKDLKWETNKNFNVGFDLGLFDNRVTVEFDYFIRSASDLLYNRPLPPSEGFSYAPENIGDMRNTGVEFVVSADLIRTPDFRWNVQFIGDHIKNKITKLPPVKDPGIVNGYQLHRVGGTIYDFYLVDYAGVDPNTGLSTWWYTNPKTNEREKTTVYSEASENGRIIAGTAVPDFTGGLNMTFEYKGIDLSIMNNFQIGGKILDYSYAYMMHGGASGGNWHKDIANAWTEDNRTSDIPRVNKSDQNVNSMSTRFLEKADYFNIRNITLGYTFDNKTLSKYYLSGLRVYGVVDNIALFSRRKGLDPRQGLSSGITGGSQVSGRTDETYTPIRSYSIGVSLNF